MRVTLLAGSAFARAAVFRMKEIRVIGRWRVRENAAQGTSRDSSPTVGPSKGLSQCAKDLPYTRIAIIPVPCFSHQKFARSRVREQKGNLTERMIFFFASNIPNITSGLSYFIC